MKNLHYTGELLESTAATEAQETSADGSASGRGWATRAPMGMWGGWFSSGRRSSWEGREGGRAHDRRRFHWDYRPAASSPVPGLADKRRTVNRQWWRGDGCAVAVDDGEMHETADRLDAAGRSEPGLVPD